MEFFHKALQIRYSISEILANDFYYKGEEKSQWFVRKIQDKIFDMTEELMNEIIMANSIYPVILQECDERRIHQDRAIGLCYSLASEFEYIVKVFNFDVGKFSQPLSMISDEINLLKGWRKSDNRIRDRISSNKND